jgi:hypothetical protein
MWPAAASFAHFEETQKVPAHGFQAFVTIRLSDARCRRFLDSIGSSAPFPESFC